MKINPRQIERMMKQMGMNMKTIEAEEVIIKTSDKEIVIKNPEVAKINVMGQETFQISGTIEERNSIREDDIRLVMEKTGAGYEDAKKALEAADGDIAEAIISLEG